MDTSRSKRMPKVQVKRGRRYVAAAAAGALAISLGATTASFASQRRAAPQVTITFATNQIGPGNGLSPALTKLISQFEQKYRNVHIQLIESQSTALQSVIQLDFSSHKVPDVFNFWRPDPAFNMNNYIASGELANLGSLYREPAVRKEFPALSWATATKQGKVWGIPMVNFFVPFVVNTAVFKAANLPLPTTWSRLVKDVPALKAKGYIPWAISTGTADQNDDRVLDYVFDRMLGNQAALNLFAGKGSWTSPKVVQAIADTAQITVNDAPVDASSLDDAEVLAKYFNTGKAAMYLGNSGFLTDISGSVLSHLKVLPFPLIPGGAEKTAHTEKDLTTLMYASSQAYNDPTTGPYVKDFLLWVTSPKAEQMYADASTPVPAVSVRYKPSDVGSLLAAAEKVQQPELQDVWLGEARQPSQELLFYPLVQEFWVGKFTPPQFAQQMQSMFH